MTTQRAHAERRLAGVSVGRFLAFLLAGTLTTAGARADAPLGPIPDTQQTPDVWAPVHGLPPGSLLKLTFSDGSEVTGRVVETRPDAVVMNANRPGRSGLKTPPGSILEDDLVFARSRVVEVSILKVATRYDAGREPNVEAVRRVIAALGTGKKIDLRTTSSTRSQRATIRSIGEDGFSVVQGFRAPATIVAYGDVSRVKAAGLPGFLKGAIIVSVGLAVLNILAWTAVADAS